MVNCYLNYRYYTLWFFCYVMCSLRNVVSNFITFSSFTLLLVQYYLWNFLNLYFITYLKDITNQIFVLVNFYSLSVLFIKSLQELIKQKVKRQLTKQQKSAIRRRLQKGEANIFTKQRRENMQNIKSSLEAASFWG